LIDLKDPTRSFTWSNNQDKPILAALDIVLVSVSWDAKYPLARVRVLPKGVSDHNPLAIKFGENKSVSNHIFIFEKWWLEVDGFDELVKKV
jgi:hypothetical protein